MTCWINQDIGAVVKIGMIVNINVHFWPRKDIPQSQQMWVSTWSMKKAECSCQNGLQEDPTQFPVTLAREALKEIEVTYSDFKRPNNIHLVAHDEGHVIDLPSLLSFFTKHLGQRTGDR